MTGIGDLDPTFGNGGFVSTDFFAAAAPSNVGYDTATQADGKIIVAGDHMLARYLPNGDLDPEFGDEGLVTFPDFSLFAEPFTGVGLQADGKIIVARTVLTNSPGYDFSVSRYNTDGTLDTSFGAGGTTVTDLSNSNDRVTGLVIQPDGKIVVGGAILALGGNANKFAVVRYTADGALDGSFNGNGKNLAADGAAFDVALGADGKIVAVGQSIGGGIAVARYLATGALDSSFDGDGVVVTDLSPGVDSAEGVAIQADGKVVVTGYTGFGAAVLRYDQNGGLDSTFSGDGMVITFTGDLTQGHSVAVQADGGIVVAGHSTNLVVFVNKAVLLRLLSNGDFDTSFSGDGFAALDTPTIALDVDLQSDGKILAAGATSFSSQSRILLARFLTDGDLDTTFSDDGIAVTNVGESADFARAAALQADGKVVVAGYSNTSGRQVAVARYLPDGSLDPTFSTNGKVSTFAGEVSITSVVIQADGKILVGGTVADSGDRDFLLIRYLSDGRLDLSFDGDGIVTTDVPGILGDKAAVAVHATGRIVIVGSSHNGNDSDVALARYLSDGSLDTGFSFDGIQAIDLGGEEFAADVAMLPNWQLVVGGSKDGDLLVVRYTADGLLDSNFDGDGFATTDFGGTEKSVAMSVQPNETVLLAGVTGNGVINEKPVLARYTARGALDATFDGDGKLTIDVPTEQAQVASVAVQADGKILLAGGLISTVSIPNAQYFAVYRLDADGSPDSYFGSDGVKDFWLTDTQLNEAAELLIDAEGNYLLAGTIAASQQDFALIKLQGDGPLLFEAENELAHLVGHAEGGWAAQIATDSAGYLSYGPYTSAVPLGLQTAIFRLQVADDVGNKAPVVTIDVYDFQAGRTLAKRVLYKDDFGATNFWHEFKLDFENFNPNAVLEFRTFWHDQIGVKLDGVQIVPSETLQYQAETDFGHLVGHADGDGWAASKATDAASYLAYGPYTSDIDPGFYSALYRLKANGAAAPTAPVVTLDVWDYNAGKLVAQRVLHGSDFPVNTNLDFTLDFEVTNPNAVLEFRTFWHDTADVKLDLVRILPREAPLQFEAETQLAHRVGHADGDGWAATAATDSANYLSAGPYTQQVEQGANTAIFRLQTHGAAATAQVVTIDVWDHQSKQILAQRTLLGSDFAAADTYQDFALDFVNTNLNAAMEFHTFWHDTADVKLDYVRVYARQVANYEAETQFVHQVGQAETDGWKATSATAAAAYLAFGPYTDDIHPGQYTAVYRLKSSVDLIPAPVVTIDVWDHNANRSLARLTLLSTDFSGTDYQDFELDFEVTNPTARLEFRTFWHDNTDVKLDRVRILDDIFAGGI